MASLWGLPGPHRFVENVADDLRGGSSVVLRFGGNRPAGLAVHLEQLADWSVSWMRLDANSQASPFATLRRAAAPEARATDLATPQRLVADDRFRNRVFWIADLTPENWPSWRRFLLDFAHASRNAEAAARPPVFLLPLCGGGFDVSGLAEPAISCRTFRDVVDRDDLFIMALQSRQARRRPRRVIRSLLAHSVAQVAQWDHVLAEVLLDGGPEAAMQPQATLAHYAENRGWTAETPESWENGSVGGPPERPVVHSALLMVQGRERELNRRIWAAQAAVLMPLLEERRLELVERHRDHMTELPLETDFGLVETPDDMELGALVLYFSRYGQNGRRVLGPAHRLKKLRNELAHFRPLSYAEATHSTLLNPIR